MKIQANAKPLDDRRLDLLASAVAIEAAAPDGADKPRRFSMTAYTGGPLNLAGWRYAVIVDLQGLDASRHCPILFNHQRDEDSILGQTDTIDISAASLQLAGPIFGETSKAKRVIALNDRGYVWQASIGARAQQVEFVAEGKTVQVNGRSFSGPVFVARKARLGEVSFVIVGADDNTSAHIAATDDDPPDRSKDNFDPVAALRAEAARISTIQRLSGGKHTDIEAKAIAEGWNVERAELEILRANRPTGPAIIIGGGSALSANVLEAAVCMVGKLEGVETMYDTATLEAADHRFRGGIRLQELVMEAAWANGYTGRSFRSDMRGALEAAFSTLSLPGIFSNVANKFLLAGFDQVESSWRSIAATKPVNDFKTVTSYRLTGDLMYEEVGPDGELKHGELGEVGYQNQAKTYGKMFSATRTDFINDDLSALTVTPLRLGRGAHLKLNNVLWKLFLNNAAFFTTACKNYMAGAATALSIDSLTKAEEMFLNQTDEDNQPLAIAPEILLVPNALFVLADVLMGTAEVREDGNTSRNKYPTKNPHAGKFRVVRSSYLSNALYAGNSTDAWYLLADPATLAMIEVAFLNGQERPTVESADADFKTLGVQFRGYHDFGVALQEYRAGVKMLGAEE